MTFKDVSVWRSLNKDTMGLVLLRSKEIKIKITTYSDAGSKTKYFKIDLIFISSPLIWTNKF